VEGVSVRHHDAQVNEISVSFEAISYNENMYVNFKEACPIYRHLSVDVSFCPCGALVSRPLDQVKVLELF